MGALPAGQHQNTIRISNTRFSGLSIKEVPERNLGRFQEKWRSFVYKASRFEARSGKASK